MTLGFWGAGSASRDSKTVSGVRDFVDLQSSESTRSSVSISLRVRVRVRVRNRPGMAKNHKYEEITAVRC